MSQPAIEIDGVSKMFRLNVARHESLKERVVTFGKRRQVEEFWALRDVSFEVDQGHTVGLIGHNGSGKSTLLKCVGGILRPTSGQIRTRGRLASLLELGAGFHPDLTGRENVYLNASILGFSKRDTDVRFDDIVAFAELERFIDQQVKHYSSGMFVRLGFAVATSVEPEILLVDEVLAVGDEAFQRKCLDRIKGFQDEGRTIVFVSHAPDQVRQICDRAAVLEAGRLVTWDLPGEAVRVFREILYGFGGTPADSPDAAPTDVPKAEVVRIEAVTVSYPDPARPFVRSGEPLDVHVDFVALEEVSEAVVSFSLFGIDGRVVFADDTKNLGERLPPIHGRGRVTLRLAAVALLEGTYPLSIGIVSRDGGQVFAWRDQQDRIDVLNAEGNRAQGLADLHLKVDLSGVVASAGETPQ